jgi:hypothetical protein
VCKMILAGPEESPVTEPERDKNRRRDQIEGRSAGQASPAMVSAEIILIADGVVDEMHQASSLTSN